MTLKYFSNHAKLFQNKLTRIIPSPDVHDVGIYLLQRPLK